MRNLLLLLSNFITFFLLFLLVGCSVIGALLWCIGTFVFVFILLMYLKWIIDKLDER